MIHDTHSRFCEKWTKIAQNCANDREMGRQMCEEEKKRQECLRQKTGMDSIYDDVCLFLISNLWKLIYIVCVM